MASLEKTVSVIFSGIDKTGDVISGISKNIDQFSGKIESVAQPLSDVADGVLKVDAALAALVAGGMALAINQAGKFSDSFNEISTLTDASSEALKLFKEDILEYSRSSTASIDDINKAVYTAISAGTDYKNSLDLLSTSEKLSVAGKSDLESTTRLLASSLNAYGESTDKATDYSDALFKTVKLGQTTIPELAASLAQVSTTAANSGVSFDELMASIAAVTATGAPTSQAITAIKAAIAAIVKPSSEAADEAEKLGIEFNASALATKGLDGVLKDVYNSTGGATSQIVKLFGSTESLPAVMTLGADASGKFAATLAEFGNKTGATAEAYAKMADNFNLTNQTLANNVKATFIQAGSELLTGYTDVVESLTEVFKSVGFSIDAGAFDDIFKALNVFGEDISKFLDALAKTLPEALDGVDFSGLLNALGELGKSIGGMFSGFDPGSVQDVQGAIQFVVDTIESLITVTKGMVDSFKPFIATILSSIDAFNQMNDADKESAGNILGLAKAVTVLGAEMAAVMIIIGKNADDIGRAFDAIAGSIKIAWGGFATGLQVISLAALESIDFVLAGIEKVTFGEWNEKIKSARSGIQEEIAGMTERMNSNIETVHKGWDQLTDAFASTDIKAGFSLDMDNLEKQLKAVDWSRWDDTIAISPALDMGQLEIDLKGVDWSDWGETKPLVEAEIRFKTTYQWTDADGGQHFSDSPPDPNDVVGDIDEIKTPIKPTVDDKEIEKVKKKISEATSGSITNMTVSPTFDFSDYSEKMNEAMGAVPTPDFDLGGLAELIGGMDDLSSSLSKGLSTAAIEAQIRLMNSASDQQTAAAQAMKTAADLQWRAANIRNSSSEANNTIRIDASGVEPEIEAFMWKILKKIQIRANESGAEFLLSASD